MNRRHFSALLLASLPVACSWFEAKKKPLPGERIAVLGLDNRLEPDPAVAGNAVTVPPPAVNPEWAEPGGNPAHDPGHVALPERLTQVWQTSIGDGSSRHARVMSQPVIAQGRIFAMDGGVQVSALDPASGNQVWRVDLKPEQLRGTAFGGGPCFWNGRLFVSTGYAQVVALDPATGRELWRQNVTAPVHAPPTVLDGRVFVVTVENELIALSANDGTRAWSHNGIPETAGLLGGASPAAEGDTVVVAYTSGELFALRVENGRVVWSDNLASAHGTNAVSSLASIRGRPVIDRGRVYAVSHSGRMAAIDLRSGDRVWEQEVASSHQPWVAGDFVFVLASDNTLVCLTRNDGKVRWAQQLRRYEDPEDKSNPVWWAGPVLGGNRLISVSSLGEAAAVSPANGQPLGSFEVSAGGYLGPVVANNTLYLLTDDANLSAYR